MISLRLPKDFEIKINRIAKDEKISKSELIKTALKNYIENYVNNTSPYKLGEELFGKFGSGQKDLSKTYKTRLKEKLNEKYSH